MVMRPAFVLEWKHRRRPMPVENSYVVRAMLDGVPLVLPFRGSYENVYCGAKELYPGIKIQSITQIDSSNNQSQHRPGGKIR